MSSRIKSSRSLDMIQQQQKRKHLVSFPQGIISENIGETLPVTLVLVAVVVVKRMNIKMVMSVRVTCSETT